MIRTFAAAGGLSLVGLAPLAAAGAASAQTWGQPVYVSPYGHVVGGSPLSEVETRAYVETGRWADGYTGQVYVRIPAPPHGRGYGAPYGQDYGSDRYGHASRGYGGYDGYGGHGRYEAGPRAGYRDVWGYNDDRPPSARTGSRDRRPDRHYRDCGCGDVYLRDR